MLPSLILPDDVPSDNIDLTFLSAIQDGHLEDVQLCLYNHANIDTKNKVLERRLTTWCPFIYF